MSKHRLFPLGLNDVHCGDWRKLEDAILHIDQEHADCWSCQIERMLCVALLDEAKGSVIRVEGEWLKKASGE